jgi:hypothetical protein
MEEAFEEGQGPCRAVEPMMMTHLNLFNYHKIIIIIIIIIKDTS